MGQRDFRFAFDRELSDDAEKPKYHSIFACMEALMDDRTKLDLFCIATFCVVDELYQRSAILEPIRKRRNLHKGFSDVELITAVIVGETNGQGKAKTLYRWVCCQFPGWFPQMPEWSRSPPSQLLKPAAARPSLRKPVRLYPHPS